jgi:hypothetical protein
MGMTNNRVHDNIITLAAYKNISCDLGRNLTQEDGAREPKDTDLHAGRKKVSEAMIFQLGA